MTALRAVLAATAIAAVSGCFGRSPPPPVAGYERGGVPDLRGARVLVLPLQFQRGTHPDVAREVEFAFERTSGAIDWVGPAELRELIRRTPGLDLSIDGLPVGMFLSGEVLRVGDPLFGALYRLGAVANAPIGLIPIEARARAHEAEESVEISATLIELRSGRVIWFGIVQGSLGPPGDLSIAATAAEALALRVSLP